MEITFHESGRWYRASISKYQECPGCGMPVEVAYYICKPVRCPTFWNIIALEFAWECSTCSGTTSAPFRFVKLRHGISRIAFETEYRFYLR